MKVDSIVLSLRQIRKVPWYGGVVEAEDALVHALDAVRLDVVAERGTLGGQTRRGRAARRLLTLAPVAEPFATDPKLDVHAHQLIIVVNDLHDLALSLSVRGWETLADEVVIHVSEISERHLFVYGSTLRRIQRCANHLFMGSRYIDPERLAGRNTRSLGVTVPLVDVLAFPERAHGARSADVLSFGRHSVVQHDVLDSWTGEVEGRQFERDRIPIDSVVDLNEHRRNFVARATDARVIITNHARFDEPKRRAGVCMLGTRFIEAAAAGSVLAGKPPSEDLPGYAGLLDELGISTFDIEANVLPPRLRELLEDPDASQEVGRNARRVALEQLDIAHQWVRMAALSGFALAPGVTDRLRELDEVQHLSN